MTDSTIPLPWPSGFSLTASSRFVMNFAASQGGIEAPALNLTFALDRTWQTVSVRVSEQGTQILAEVVTNPDGAEDEVIRQNLVRILNLHVEKDPLAAIGERDPIVEHLRQRYTGLRPVQFPTPWEAAAWAVIGHRIRITQAAAIKRRLSERFGHRTEFPGGQVLDSFPGPDVVLSLPAMQGLTVRKFDTLKGIAQAAIAGGLDSEHLLTLPAADASAELQKLYGIGPFSAELILVRGAGAADLFPTSEPRLAKAMTALYCTDDPADHLRIAEQWQPYRSWAALLIRRWLEDETQEIAQGITVYEVPTPAFASLPEPL